MDTTVNSVCMHRIDLKQQYHRDIVPLRSKEKNNFRLREEEKTPGNCSAKEVYLNGNTVGFHSQMQKLELHTK